MEKDIAEVIGDINKVAMLINLQGKHHVFTHISGHVSQIEISLHLGGWSGNKQASLSENIYYDRDCIKELRKIRDVLHKIYKNGKINMENCNYEIEEVKHYKFC